MYSRLLIVTFLHFNLYDKNFFSFPSILIFKYGIWYKITSFGPFSILSIDDIFVPFLNKVKQCFIWSLFLLFFDQYWILYLLLKFEFVWFTKLPINVLSSDTIFSSSLFLKFK